MDSTIIVGILSLVGIFVGILSGIFINNKHNNLIDRMYKIENRITVLGEVK